MSSHATTNTSAAAETVPVPKRTKKVNDASKVPRKQNSKSTASNPERTKAPKKRKAPEVVANDDVESAVVVPAMNDTTVSSKKLKVRKDASQKKEKSDTKVNTSSGTDGSDVVRKADVPTPLYLVDTDENHSTYKTWCKEIGANITRKQFSTMIKRQRTALNDMCRRSNKRVVVVDETLDNYSEFLTKQTPSVFKELHGRWIRIHGIDSSLSASDLSANRDLKEENVLKPYMYSAAKLLFDACVRHGYKPLGIASAGKPRGSDDYNVSLDGPSVSVVDRNAAQGVTEAHKLALVSSMCVRKPVHMDDVFGVGRPMTTYLPTSRKAVKA